MAVHLLCQPPHCSHLQPLDFGVFKLIKDEWRKLLKGWYKDSRMKHIDKGQFSKLLKKLYENTKQQLAVAGFAKCGIYPFDPTVIASDKPAPAETFDKELGPVGRNQVSSEATTIAVSSSENQNTAVTDARSASPVATCSRVSTDSPCTPKTGMKKAVLAQLKVGNGAVRQKTGRMVYPVFYCTLNLKNLKTFS